jgi:hypothetical protein
VLAPQTDRAGVRRLDRRCRLQRRSRCVGEGPGAGDIDDVSISSLKDFRLTYRPVADRRLRRGGGARAAETRTAVRSVAQKTRRRTFRRAGGTAGTSTNLDGDGADTRNLTGTATAGFASVPKPAAAQHELTPGGAWRPTEMVSHLLPSLSWRNLPTSMVICRPRADGLARLGYPPWVRSAPGHHPERCRGRRSRPGSPSRRRWPLVPLVGRRPISPVKTIASRRARQAAMPREPRRQMLST